MKYLLYNNTLEPLKDVKLQPYPLGTKLEHVSGSNTIIPYAFEYVVLRLKQEARKKNNIVEL